jgi:hypothetical protein
MSEFDKVKDFVYETFTLFTHDEFNTFIKNITGLNNRFEVIDNGSYMFCYFDIQVGNHNIPSVPVGVPISELHNVANKSWETIYHELLKYRINML